MVTHKRKIIVRMMGGLGNQLFQYSFALKVQELYGGDIYLDISAYEKYKIRNFELFNLIGKEIKVYKKFSCMKYETTYRIYHIIQAIYRSIFKKRFYAIKKLVNRGYFYSADNKLCWPDSVFEIDNIYIWGYFQNVDIADGMKMILNNKFSLRSSQTIYNDYLRLIQNVDNSIAISIRCGWDYKKAGWKIQNKEYYIKSIERIKKEKGLLDNINFVFSDDVVEAKKIMGDIENTIFIDNLPPVEALFLIKKCNDYVISNSSFSWWAAYLGESSKKIVCMPSIWYPKCDGVENLVYLNCIIV